MYETGMGLCFFLVWNRDDSQLFSGWFLEFSGAHPGVCMRIPAILQMLRIMIRNIGLRAKLLSYGS